MSSKPNVRSFRYSDEVAAILDGYPGKNLNDSFEQLVLYCYYKLPKIKQEIEQKQNDLNALNNQILQAKVCLNECKELVQAKIRLAEALSFVTMQGLDLQKSLLNLIEKE